MTELDLSDIQGFVVRGYRVNVARHFFLQITQAAAAQQFLGRLVAGDHSLPQITTAKPWHTKPELFLNLGLTCAGLKQLGVDTSAFPRSFQLGATDPITLQRVCDTDKNDPRTWLAALANSTDLHLVVSLWAMSAEALDRGSEQLRLAFEPGLRELLAHDAQALPANKVHFGYTDNIAQPTIEGVPARKHGLADAQPVAKAGEFLLGYPNDQGGTYELANAALSRNSSFAAFRILAQDAPAFEQFLTQAAQQTKLDAELIAAKVCGRWRNGLPLSLAPTEQHPHPPVPHQQINNFSYKDDPYGLKCPLGSHIRRTNPRDEPVTGGEGDGSRHRIVRRAMPYGPAYDPHSPDDQHERGLIGWFINADLDNQFEHIMSSWVNDHGFVIEPLSWLTITGRDVLLGNPQSDDTFALPESIKPNVIQKLSVSQFVTTRGGAYCYLPSITAIRYLAGLSTTPGSTTP